MPTTLPLFGEALRAAAEPWLDELGKSDRERLEGLLGLAVRERLRLSDCLAALFPGMEPRKAQTALTSFRKRLNDAAKGEGRSDLGLRFHVDSNKQNPPTERFCWFTGPDPAVMQAERYSEQLIADIKGRPYVPTKGIATTESASAPGDTLALERRRVSLFVSYAHHNSALVQPLLKELRLHFDSSARYEFHIWSDHDLQVGEPWRRRIQKSLEACDFGLLMVSPAFLASNYIGQHELPPFVEEQGKPASKPVLPVGLARVLFDAHALKNLDQHQFFLFKSDRQEGRYYDEMRSGPRKRDFARELYGAIVRRLDAGFGQRPEPPTSPRGPDTHRPDSLADHVPVPAPTQGFQRTRGHRVALGELERLDAGEADHTEPREARDALNELETWAKNSAPDAPPFFALLGEYGIGKTTTLKQLTRHLLDARKSNPGLPLPIYVDLREYSAASVDGVPTIEQLLSSVIQRSWKLRDRTITAEGVLRLVQEEGAVILFDGLDEQLVHLPPDRARRFIRTLWAVLPDATRTGDSLPAGKRRGKLLISCRSHYFRDVWSQNAMLVGEDREGFERNRFPALNLLPFTEEQIKGYLTSLLSAPERVAEAFELIASIHNLRDLAKRPFLLTLISGQLEQLEKLRTRGEEVNAARLYDLIVRSWLNRDDGKHQLDPVHKRRLMEELAAALWRSDTKQWDVERLETWFDEFLAGNPALAAAYANKDRIVLKEDLRTATFVLRPTTEEKQEQKHFRFAHTSLQEYFLAAHLARALVEGKVDRWELPGVSRETLDFLGQILVLEPQQAAALRSLEKILGGERVQAAVLAFSYWLRALVQGFPAPVPARVNLSGANLEEWHLRGRGPTQPLNLRRANLSNVRLNRARVEYVDLADADLTSMAARQALFLKVSAPNARARDTDLRGAKWREGSLVGADFSGAQLTGCQWLQVGLEAATLPEGWERIATAVKGRRNSLPDQADASALVPVPLFGHSGAVWACAWSPDSQRLLSGSSDNALNVWDAGAGECLLTLSGHTDTVNACAWSPDGQRLLSGSSDNTLRVWDAGSGECLRTLSDHAGAVMACAWSPDSQRLLSGSFDNTLRVWNAGSGECLLTLSGHTDTVNACAWSPDGQRLLSSSDDHSLKVWDAGSGECLFTLSAHTDMVNACAWSPDGHRLLSGASDNTLRVWDAGSGECLLTLSDHAKWVWACAWSPDGQRLLSGSSDNTLKVWDVGSGECLRTLSGHSNPVWACAWSPDGQRLFSGAADNTLRVWDAGSAECLLTLSDHANRVWACAWSPDGQRLLSGSSNNTLKVWDAGSAECLLTLSGHADTINTCAWSPDGQRLLSSSDDNSLKVWDAKFGECLLTLSAHDHWVRACAWSPDGQRLLSGSEDNTLKVWDAKSGECLLTLSGHTDPVNACAWSPDGQRLLSGSSDNTLRVWDAGSAECLLTLSGHTDPVNACAWSPDGQRLLSGSSDRSLKVWDAKFGECLLTLSSHDYWVRACAWSPDSQRLLSGSSDNALKVWDARSGECLLTLFGHSSSVNACAWSPDGQRLLSGSSDNMLKVWDASSGQCYWSNHLLPEGQTASIDDVHGRILHASPEAWRWLGWRWTNPATGSLRILPAEFFGPLSA